MTTYSDEALQPPYSVDLIADLHADNLPAGLGPKLWPLALRDPDAKRTLDALDRVTASLNLLDQDQCVASPIPADVADRLDRSLGIAPSNVTQLPQPRPAQWQRWVAASAAVAAAAALMFAVTTLRSAPEQNTEVTAGSLDLGSDLPVATLMSAIGRYDASGPLADKASLNQCLATNDIAATRAVLGSTSVRFQGQDAVLVLVAGVTPPQITALVVGPGCSATDAAQLAKTDIG